MDCIDTVQKEAEQYIPISHLYTMDLVAFLTEYVVKFKLVSNYDNFLQYIDEKDQLFIQSLTDKYYNKTD